ncbi:MAG: phosphoribosylaminoimidazolesuccinocarboxamide synthase [bacterium]
MATLSPVRAGFPVLGLDLLSRGKVRDTYELDHGCLLSSATDGISIFDFVLNALVPQKGIILNAMNHFWLQYLTGFGIKTHFVAAGADIDPYLPVGLQRNIDLQSRAIVVRRLHIAPVEFIGRAVLTGSAIKCYAENGQVCGHQLLPGLQDGDALPCILDTPTTKAEVGHDENLSAQQVREKYPQQTYMLLQIFQIASHYAEQQGIKLADTKLEFGECGTIGDEILTPDSSRFWELKAWQDGRKVANGRKAPPPYDKQLVRAWGITQGINKLKPENPDDVVKVQSMVVPDSLIKQTTRTYRYIFWRLTGCTIESYLCKKMGVSVERKVKTIAIVCGSESDLPVVRDVFATILPQEAKLAVHVMSCHRNPLDVMAFAEVGCKDVDAVICAGGKAFALPGVIDAFSHYYDVDIPVIGVALGEPDSEELLAAKLSIKQLPGAPVIMDEIEGKPYVGSHGLSWAIRRIIDGELPPPKPRTEKPVQMNAFRNF